MFFCLLVNLFQGVSNVDFKFFVGYGKVKVPIKVILKNYTNFVTDAIGQIKWKPGNKVETVPAARVKKRLLFEPVHRATP